MSLSLSALRELVDLGLTAEQILRVAEAQAEGGDATRQRTKGAERQARYEERKRQKASESVRTDVISDGQDEGASLPLPPSPQTPQPPTPSREYNTPLPPEGRSRRKPSKPIPDGFPTADAIAEQQAKARAAGANLDVTAQAERFRNHAAQNDRRCADWRAAWRNWIAAAIERAPKTAVASLAQRQAQTQPADERWRRWIREYRQNRYWPKDDAGPAPGAPGCRVPQAILAEFGFSPAAANDTPKPDLFEGGAAA